VVRACLIIRGFCSLTIEYSNLDGAHQHAAGMALKTLAPRELRVLFWAAAHQPQSVSASMSLALTATENPSEQTLLTPLARSIVMRYVGYLHL
jgi:hypothetical protein